MRKTNLVALLLLLMPLTFGCQTDKRGVEVDLGAAVRIYKQGIDRSPTRAQVELLVSALSPEQLNDLGVLYEREGRLDRAAWAYQQAIWRNPRFATAYVNLGNVLRKQEKMEEALFRYRQAMSADRGNFAAANNFADLCAERGLHLEEAIGRLKARLDKAGPHRAYGLDTLGWLYHLTGDETRAEELLKSALEAVGSEEPNLRATIHEHLAATYRATRRDAEAETQQAEALRLRRQTNLQ